MKEYLGIFVTALIGGLAGGAAVLAVAAWAQRLARKHAPGRGARNLGDRSDLDLVRGDVMQAKRIAERVLEEVVQLARSLKATTPVTSDSESTLAGPSSAPSQSELPRHEPVGWSQGHGEGSGRQSTSYRPPSPPRDAWENQGQTDWTDRSDARLTDRPAYETFDQPAHSPFDPPPLTLSHASAETPAAPRAPAGPPPNAVNVEARDDRIVASSSYPPEAWLEPRGPAVAHLWLNPSVALNENALRRLSTFFEWRGERAGATYDTDKPAILRWDEGQRVGTIKERGFARPR